MMLYEFFDWAGGRQSMMIDDSTSGATLNVGPPFDVGLEVINILCRSLR